MTKKVHILLLVLTFGFSLMSTASYACGKSSEKMSCEKKTASQKKDSDSCSKDCCKKDSHSKKGCSGKCDHFSCTTSGLQLSLLMQNDIELGNNPFNLTFKESIGYYKNSTISDGFTSIWLLPKIN